MHLPNGTNEQFVEIDFGRSCKFVDRYKKKKQMVSTTATKSFI